MALRIGQPRPQGLDTLFEGVGQGFAKGYESGIQSRIKNMLDAEKTQITPIGVRKIAGQFLPKDEAEEVPLEAWQEISDKANSLKARLGPEQAMFTAFNEFLNPPEEPTIYTKKQLEEQDKEKQKEVGKQNKLVGGILGDLLQGKDSKYVQGYKKGLQTGIPGKQAAIKQGIGFEEFQQMNQLEDPDVLERLAHGFGRLSGDLPTFLGGTAAARRVSGPGPYGKAIQGAAGFGLTRMLDAALTEYMQYMDQGGDVSFGEFLQSADRVAGEGLIGGAEGIFYAGLGKMIEPLSKIPKMKALFDLKGVGPASEGVIKSGIEAAGLLTAQAAGERKLPSKQDVADTFALTLGLNLAHVPLKVFDKIKSRIKKSGKSAEQVATEIAGKENLEDPKKLYKAVVDVTSEPSRAKDIAQERMFKTSPEENAASRKKEAQKIAKGPLKETLSKEEQKQKAKERPLTEREIAKRETAKKESEKLQSKIERISDDITFLKEKTEKGSKADQKLAQIALESKQKELKTTQEKKADLEAIAKTGREAFLKERTEKKAQERLKDLVEISRNLETENAKKMKADFARDQKYIDGLQESLRTGLIEPDQFIDRYVKELDVYQNMYEKAIKDLQARKEATADPATKKQLENLEKILKQNQDINASKTALHRQKKGVLKKLKGKPSAILRQMLKGMRKDIPQLQKDIIRYKEFTDGLDQKSKYVFNKSVKRLEQFRKNPTESNLKGAAKESGINEKTIKDNLGNNTRKERIEKAAGEYLENPSAENLRKLSESTGLDPQEIQKLYNKKTLKNLENIFDGVVEKVSKGENPSKIGSWFKKEMQDFKNKRLKKIGQAVAGALLIGPLRKYLKEEHDISLPYGAIFMFLPFTSGIRYGSATMGILLEQGLKKHKIKQMREEYEKAGSPQARIKYLQKLKKEGTKPGIINKVREKR